MSPSAGCSQGRAGSADGCTSLSSDKYPPRAASLTRASRLDSRYCTSTWWKPGVSAMRPVFCEKPPHRSTSRTVSPSTMSREVLSDPSWNVMFVGVSTRRHVSQRTEKLSAGTSGNGRPPPQSKSMRPYDVTTLGWPDNPGLSKNAARHGPGDAGGPTGLSSRSPTAGSHGVSGSIVGRKSRSGANSPPLTRRVTPAPPLDSE